jgi:predicted aspartyl protease
LASVECGYASHDELVREGPSLYVIVNNQSGTDPVNRHLPALIDTGAEWNLIEGTLASGVLHLRRIDDQWIQTANGATLAPVYSAQLTVAGLTYSKSHRFIGVSIGADRILLGREGLQDFVLTYSGRTGKVTLQY